jgi:hypothetical protein
MIHTPSDHTRVKSGTTRIAILKTGGHPLVRYTQLLAFHVKKQDALWHFNVINIADVFSFYWLFGALFHAGQGQYPIDELTRI